MSKKLWLISTTVNKALHPKKPEELLKRIVLGFSNEDDIVLDPFAGSGTTAYIAKKYQRYYIAIEKEKKYFEAMKNRVEGVSINSEKVLKNSVPYTVGLFKYSQNISDLNLKFTDKTLIKDLP